MFNYFFTLLISPMFLFSGTFFPLDELPRWAKIVAWFLPLTHAVQGAREVFAGRFSMNFVFSIVWLLLVGFAVAALAVWKMEKRLRI